MHLSKRERHTVLAGSAIAGLIVAAWAVIPFGRDPATGGPAGKALYARYSALAGEEEVVRRALERARAADAALRRELIGEVDPGLAGAAMLELVQGAAARGRLQLERALLEAPDSVGGALQKIAVQALLMGDIHGLRQFLYELARAPQTLTLEQLRVDVVSGPTGATFSPSRAPLQIHATISGYAP